MKIYLSKSNSCDPSLYLRVKNALNDHDVFEYSPNKNNKKQCDVIVTIPHQGAKLDEDDSINVGKGIFSEIEAFYDNRRSIYVVLEEDNIMIVEDLYRDSDQNDWKKNYGSLICYSVEFEDANKTEKTFVNDLLNKLKENSVNIQSQTNKDSGSNVPGYLDMINRRKKLGL